MFDLAERVAITAMFGLAFLWTWIIARFFWQGPADVWLIVTGWAVAVGAVCILCKQIGLMNPPAISEAEPKGE